ncbi:hypothetical protein GVO57_13915 [Sphingomonas changnyeongensis]|uniref:Uncharacterized protein n=1 Tax=Sphingomonas changnyeongensis TaxID=2698679 RepID=A0A7Z2NYC4_9SPHN|nr:hypothetical protein [Sphingomonas changnyeongensis]QHL91691.1 hypothetical protein GVO57_13915 [Sphingomonas changnyeongensis]
MKKVIKVAAALLLLAAEGDTQPLVQIAKTVADADCDFNEVRVSPGENYVAVWDDVLL